MSWVRLDDGFATHPKIVRLTDREFRIWVRLLCYCAANDDPSIDRVTLKSVPGLTPKLVAKLHRFCLVDKARSGHEIHDWAHYQPKDKTGAERQARWRSRRQEQAKQPRYATVTPTVTETVTPAVTPPVTKPLLARTGTRPDSSKGSTNPRGHGKGLPFTNQLLYAELLSLIGNHGDENTAVVLRSYATRATEAQLAKVLESARHADPDNRAGYVVAALRDEVDGDSF